MVTFSKSPIIVVGCHRSGTSFLTEKLKTLGVFMGKDLNDHAESMVFLECNDALLDRYNSSWFEPERFLSMRSEQTKDMDKLKTVISPAFKWKRIVRYIGIYRWITSLWKSSGVAKQRWGWKDPRSSLTLSVWLYFFPEAKVIHLSRNGWDVAKSLQTRELNRSRDSKYRAEKCKDLNYSYNLWQSYEKAIADQLVNIDPSRVMHIHFDRLISDPTLDEELKNFID